MFMSRSKKGFTLAEVLITLLIIGVVASLVIPALIGDTQQAELKVALKKAVASANQALAMSIAQDQTDASGTVDDSNSNLMNLFAAKLNVIQSDTSTATLTTADGMIFTFFTKGACSASTDPNASQDITTSNANCYALVDVNGAKRPNTLSSNGSYKDQYYLVIRSKTVVPGKSASDDEIALQAMYQ